MTWPTTCPKDSAPVVRRDLDGDYCPVAPEEKIRRGVQAAVMGGNVNMAKVVTSVVVDKVGSDPKRNWRVVVDYDPSVGSGDVASRQLAIAKGAGGWSSSHKGLMAILIMRDAKTQKIDFLVGQYAELIAKADSAAAEKQLKSDLNKKELPPSPAKK
jgi:hypothetical protein